MKSKKPIEKVEELIPKSIYQKNKTIYLVVNAKPNAKTSQLQEISDDGVGISIAAPPKQGEANEELLDFLSEVLCLKKSNLDLDKGNKSRNKVVAISESGYSARQVYEILLKHI